jgi:hypothetical protein
VVLVQCSIAKHVLGPWRLRDGSAPAPGVELDLSLLFFHLRDGHDVLLDPEGREIDGHAAVEAAALIEARAIISDEAIYGRINLDQHIDVEDEQRNVVHCLRFVDAVELVLPVPELVADL